MTVGVVDAFEVVEIHHQHGQMRCPRGGCRKAIADNFGECTPVQQAVSGSSSARWTIPPHRPRHTPSTQEHRHIDEIDQQERRYRRSDTDFPGHAHHRRDRDRGSHPLMEQYDLAPVDIALYAARDGSGSTRQSGEGRGGLDITPPPVHSTPSTMAASDCRRVGQRVSQKTVIPTQNTAASPPMTTAAALSSSWPNNMVNGAVAAAAQTTAMICCAVRNPPRWKRNALIHSYLSGFSPNPLAVTSRQTSKSERLCAAR